MAKFKFDARLYESVATIHSEFRAHQSTILQLSARHKVGQETMRQFLIRTLGDEYVEIVRELREVLRLNNRQSIVRYSLNSRAGMEPPIVCPLLRGKQDFSEEELKEFKRRIEQHSVNPVLGYHPYVVDPLRGEEW